MNITIKKLKTWNTTDGGGCNCSVYINNKYVGIAEDRGFGGDLDFYPDYSNGKSPIIDAKGNYVPAPEANVDSIKKLIADARDFVRNLPPVKYDYGNDIKGEYEQTLETYINDLISAELQKKVDKKVERDFQKGICYGLNTANFHIYHWRGVKTLKEFADRPGGKDSIQKSIDQLKSEFKKNKKGEKILNADVLKKLGFKI